MNLYVLDDDDQPLPIDDLEIWGKWFEAAWRSGRRNVEQTRIGNVRISTVFLGLDHNFFRPGEPPILWESMIFGGPLHETQRRYSSKADALAGHHELCVLVQMEFDHERSH